MREGPRRIYWLLLLGGLAAGAYVVGRMRGRRSPLESRSRTTGSAETISDRPGTNLPSPASGVDVDPTGPEAMVFATMEVTPVSAPRHLDQNGSKAGSSEPSGAEPKVVVGTVELPPRRGVSGATIAALAALAGVGAIVLGSWAFVSSVRSDDETSIDTARSEQVISLLSKPSTQRVPVDGSAGRIILAVGTDGQGYLVLDGLGLAPAGKSYQAWVIKPNVKAPASAAVFAGTEMIVPLSVAVRPGAVVAITIERADGAPAPTHKPKLLAQPSL